MEKIDKKKEPRFQGEVSAKSHKNMSRIRGKDTSIEIILRKALWEKGYHYRKNYKNVPGSPDIALTKYKIAIFCDGEYFHGKDWDLLKEKLQKGKNSDYWISKIQKNMERDREIDQALIFLGWTPVHFWGKDIKNNTDECIKVIEELIFELELGGRNLMEIIIEYDKSNPASIEAYAQKLIGKTFRQISDEDEGTSIITDKTGTDYGMAEVSQTKRNKGNLGQLIEEKFFHYSCNSDSRPDFSEAGVELKVTPYKKNKNGTLSAKERLILTMIDYFAVVNENFEESHMWNKSRLILLVYYLYQQDIKQNLDYKIGYTRLFTPPEQDIKIIKHDYEVIVEKIKNGKAHELSEGDTLYLGAAPKASTSKDRRKQPFSGIPAKPRAFAFKNSYMTYVLNTYIVPGKKTYEPIIVGETQDSFEEYVVNKIDSYRGQSVENLGIEFHVNMEKKPKNLEAMLAYRMLGVKGNHAEEFEKANIVIKTIRIGYNGKIKESMSFPTFKFKELINENWEDSIFGNYLRETRFLFVVYKFDADGALRLKGCQFWNIPYDDLENDVRQVWEKTVHVLKEGLKIQVINGINYNNFPKASENRVCHVRPHAQNANDTYELPDGKFYPKQCFWLNNTYILSQIDKSLR